MRERTPEQERRAHRRADAAAPTSPRWPTAAAWSRSPRDLDEDVADARRARLHGALGDRRATARRWPARPSPDDVDTFAGREIDAWVVTERTDTEIQDAVASPCPRSPRSHVFEAVADAAVDADEVDAETRTPRVAPGAPAPPPRRRRRRREGRKQPRASSTVRVDAERLDQLMHFMGELVLHRTQVEALIAQADVPGLSQAMQNLTRTSHALQAMVMQVRMIPVEAVFLRFPRLVRDLSTKLGKQVELQLVGKDTELDRTVVDALGDPLVHLVRNSLDHGLEAPEERVAAGKPATGTLEISAHHAGGNVIITVADDGRGIDPARVAAKAAERGLIAGRRGRRDRHRRAPSNCSSPPASPPPRSPATSPAAASAWTRSARRSAGSAARSCMTSELGQGHERADPPAAHAGDHGRADRRGRRRGRSRSRSTASSAPSAQYRLRQGLRGLVEHARAQRGHHRPRPPRSCRWPKPSARSVIPRPSTPAW